MAYHKHSVSPYEDYKSQQGNFYTDQGPQNVTKMHTQAPIETNLKSKKVNVCFVKSSIGGKAQLTTFVHSYKYEKKLCKQHSNL